MNLLLQRNVLLLSIWGGFVLPIYAQTTYRAVNIVRANNSLAPDSTNVLKVNVLPGTNIVITSDSQGKITINSSGGGGSIDTNSFILRLDGVGSNLFLTASSVSKIPLNISAIPEINTNLFQVYSNTVLHFIVSSNGNVGIGTNSPKTTFSVHGDSFFNGLVTNRGNIIPFTDSTFNLGDSAVRWNDVYGVNFHGKRVFADNGTITTSTPFFRGNQVWNGAATFVGFNVNAQHLGSALSYSRVLNMEFEDVGSGVFYFLVATNISKPYYYHIATDGNSYQYGTASMSRLKMTLDAGSGKILSSDASGFASWVDDTYLRVGTNILFHAGPTNGSITGKILTAGANITLTTVNNTNLEIAATSSGGSTLLTNALFHTGPTNGSVTGKILTAGNSISSATINDTNLHFSLSPTVYVTNGLVIISNTPTATDGVLWYGATRQPSMYSGGMTQFLRGTIFCQTNNVGFSNTTSETSILGVGVGSSTLPANFLRPGRALTIRAGGFFTSTSTPNITGRLRFGGVGGTQLLASAPALVSATQSNPDTWKMDMTVVCRVDGSSGKVIASGVFEKTYDVGQGITHGFRMVQATETTINTTTAQEVTVTGAWSAANNANCLMTQYFIITTEN